MDEDAYLAHCPDSHIPTEERQRQEAADLTQQPKGDISQGEQEEDEQWIDYIVAPPLFMPCPCYHTTSKPLPLGAASALPPKLATNTLK